MNRERLEQLLQQLKHTDECFWNDESYISHNDEYDGLVGCTVARCVELWPDKFMATNCELKLSWTPVINDHGEDLRVQAKGLMEFFDISIDQLYKIFGKYDIRTLEQTIESLEEVLCIENA